MGDISKLFVTGNLVRDPERKTTSNGRAVVSFTIAVGRYVREEGAERPTFYRVSVWQEREQEWLMNKAMKGTAVAVTGDYDQRLRDDGGVFNDINSPTVKITARMKGSTGGRRVEGAVAGAPSQDANYHPVDNDDDIPF
jgi:single-strand DNA-binding protein